MMDKRPFIDARTAAIIQSSVRRGLATTLAFADPKRELSVYRTERSAGGSAIVVVDQFAVKKPGLQPGGGSDGGAKVVTVPGTIRRFTPEEQGHPGGARLKAGDRFELPEIGVCIIKSVAPDRFGIEEASFVLEDGSS